MDRIEAETMPAGDIMTYLNHPILNPEGINTEDFLDDFQLLLKVHRNYIYSLDHEEYIEYKRQRNAHLN